MCPTIVTLQGHDGSGRSKSGGDSNVHVLLPLLHALFQQAILSSDGKVKFMDQDAALSVFSAILCQTVFGTTANPMVIAAAATSALDGMVRLDLQPKLEELSRWF